MTDLTLEVQPREVIGKKVNELRTRGKIPAVLYGHGIKTAHITLDYNKFEKIYSQAGESTLIDVVIDSKAPVKALIQEVQRDPLGDSFVHVDFHQVKMDEKVHAPVELKFINEAPAVKEFSGVLVTQLDSVEIECLPADLISEIEVDLSGLKTFDDVIHVSDLKVPEKVTITNQAEDAVVMVQEPRIEQEPIPAEGEEGEVAEGEEGAEAQTDQPAEKPKQEESK